MIPTSTPIAASYLRREYEFQQELFSAQPVVLQRFFEAQARRLAGAILRGEPQAQFQLPDRVVARAPQSGELASMRLPAEIRQQTVGTWIDRFGGGNLRAGMRSRWNRLQQSSDQSIATSSALLAHATVMHMIHDMLPTGRATVYRAEMDEDIPSIPVEGDPGKPSALTAASDAIVEVDSPPSDREHLLVPFVPAALRFFLPQWVAFGCDGELLLGSVKEAEADLASMQRFMQILFTAVSLAPYMVADDLYQNKRYGMLGQLVNQGRALAAYRTGEIIRTIKERAGAGKLNRGLSLSLPYFDDQQLDVQLLDFDVIPAGRIMFLPIFVVRAVRDEQAKVAQDTRMGMSTRKYLLRELTLLEQAFKEVKR